MEWTQIILCAGVLLYFLYKYGTKNKNHWKSRGVKHKKPVPFFGDNTPVIFQKTDAMSFNIDLYNRFKENRFFGIFTFLHPTLLVRDPELLKQIMVKDADHFINRFNWTQNTDPFLSKNLSLLQDEQWRNLRIVMTSVFTGAKMKDMFKFMEVCGNQATQNISKRIQEEIKKGSGSNVLEIDIKDFFSRFGTDVIGSTAFGLEVDSFKHPKNEFHEIGSDLKKTFQSFSIIKMLFMAAFPNLSKRLKLTFFGEKVNKFFVSIVNETIEQREKHNIVRKDMIHILTEARKGRGLDDEGEMMKGKLPDLTNEDIAAQAMSFFVGGFDIMSTALSFACLEMAANPEVQEKLYKDIEQVIERDNEITYDGVMHHMQYLDMVVKEVLRKWPPIVASDREVSKTYVIPKSADAPELTLSRGDTIYIPIVALHRDPEYYPDPEKFDPERFRDEKSKIKPYTYMPFGAGMRHCVAMRYALMEIKIGLVCLIKNFYIVPTKKTNLPIEVSKKNGFALEPVNGFWMGLKPRI